MNFSVADTVAKRYSVRSYDGTPVPENVRRQIMDYAAGLNNPFGDHPRLKLIDRKTSEKGEKLGTYGVIGGAELFIGAAISGNGLSAEALGYELEELVLYMTSLDLGTCWLGGTFNRSGFAAAMELDEDEYFSIVMPVGYIAKKPRLMERIFRSTTKGDNRKPWGELFFAGDGMTPLAKGAAGDLEAPLEMLRLAPSAVNKQPWRVVVENGNAHFYRMPNAPDKPDTPADMQRIDMGIGMCHFCLAAEEEGMTGEIIVKNPEITVPEQWKYLASWVRK